VHNEPPPAGTKVSIAFSPAPAGSLQPGVPIDITAVVSNDSNNAGVDWTVSCPGGSSCGTLSSPHTASGQATTFTPPSTLSTNTEVVNVVAFATADHTQNVTAPIAITGFGSNFNGTYVLQAQGIDASFGAYQFAGVVVLDGIGGITSGKQTVNFLDQNVGFLLSKSDPVTGGSYFVGTDGRGTITIKTNDPDVGLGGVQTFSLVFLSSSQALISQTDSSASAKGTMDLQTSAAAPSGGYAFVVTGTDVGSCTLGICLPTAVGGVFNIDSPNTISGNGSISDRNLDGTATLQQALSGTVSNPDSFGAVMIDLNLGFTSSPVQFAGYIVDATHIKLIETDNSSGTGFGSTGGVAIGQGAANGTFTTAALSGTYVFAIPGVDLTETLAGTTPDTFTSLGVFTADGSGNLTNGFIDTFFQQNCVQPSCTQNFILGAKISAAIGGTYAVSTTGSGRGRVNITSVSPSPTLGYSPAFVFYLAGNGSPALVLSLGDTKINPQTGLPGYPSMGAGIVYPQSAGQLTFGGPYGFSLTQQNGSETDGTGQMTADTASNTLSGFMDTSLGAFDNPLTGSFAAPGVDGRFSVDLSGPAFDFLSPSTSSFTAEFYAIDSGHGFFVETDLKDPNGPSGVVSFGYYAAHTPVCTGCP
jgi:hypothetical protein